MTMKPEELLKEIEARLFAVDFEPARSNQGRVESAGDGIAAVSGLSRGGFGEEVRFENGSRGLILDLSEDAVSCMILDGVESISRGMTVTATGRVLGIACSPQIIGRVIDPLGQPLDGGDALPDGEWYPFEKIAPGIVERRPVDRPLKTGISAIDALTPIGRGQRELIIGDRNTGKTAVAIDAILNQKKCDLGLKRVICIYCAIGQKRVNVARVVDVLSRAGAMAYSIVVTAGASDSAALQYLAPMSACAIGEYFMDQGEDVLVIYDDLTKHAWSYRQVSLLIKRPAGREAYPGDIFFLHSRLLERAARMAEERGGGTLTALPIIETQANDVSAYIPTNIISITDGQIYLEADLFNAGVRPAINAGLSVSRVGGAAQSRAMKQLAGSLRIELAQFRELQVFTQFGSDLDADTVKRLERGRRLVEILKQPQFEPREEVAELVGIFAVTSGAFDAVAIERVQEMAALFVEDLRTSRPAVIERLSSGGKLDEAFLTECAGLARAFAGKQV